MTLPYPLAARLLSLGAWGGGWGGGSRFLLVRNSASVPSASGPARPSEPLALGSAVPRAWIERLVELADQIRANKDQREIGLDYLLGYIESARGLLTDVTKPE